MSKPIRQIFFTNQHDVEDNLSRILFSDELENPDLQVRHFKVWKELMTILDMTSDVRDQTSRVLYSAIISKV